MIADCPASCAPAPTPRRRTLPWAAAAVLCLAGAAAVLPAPAVVGGEPGPELTLFRDRIEPVLQNVCSQCHAGVGKGEFKLIVHAPGIALSDEEERTNYRTILKLLVPGKPDQSKFLLKPLAERDGGVKHGGGDRIYKGTAAYRNWVEFITSVKAGALEPEAPKPGSPAAAKPGAPAAPPMPSMPSMGSAPGQPDLGFFAARVEPVLLGVCSQCHAGAGKGQFALIVHTGGTRFPLADHQKNFDTVLKLLVPGKPDQSKFLLKPLAERDGGVKHGGGDRISKGDPNYQSWVDFINGVKGPPPPSDVNPEDSLPSVSDKGLTLEIEEGKLSGDAAAAPIEGATGKCVAPGAAGGRVALRFRAGRRGDYTLAFRALAAPRGFRVRVDGGEFLDVAPPKEGWAEVGPVLPLDEGKPLDGRLGRLTVVPATGAGGAEGAVIQMDGREGMARWLSPADLPHARLEATVTIPGDDLPGRDDAWLLFDCLDRENGKFFGLVDGGRKLAMGVIEGGRPRILKTAPAPAGIGGDKPFTLAVDLLDGLAVGRLDGKPAVGVNFDRGLGAARFGFLTHGIASVASLVARRGTEEVHRAKFSSGGVLHLVKGTHSLEIELLPQGAALDTVLVKEVSAP